MSLKNAICRERPPLTGPLLPVSLHWGLEGLGAATGGPGDGAKERGAGGRRRGRVGVEALGRRGRSGGWRGCALPGVQGRAAFWVRLRAICYAGKPPPSPSSGCPRPAGPLGARDAQNPLLIGLSVSLHATYHPAKPPPCPSGRCPPTPRRRWPRQGPAWRLRRWRSTSSGGTRPGSAGPLTRSRA